MQCSADGQCIWIHMFLVVHVLWLREVYHVLMEDQAIQAWVASYNKGEILICIFWPQFLTYHLLQIAHTF